MEMIISILFIILTILGTSFLCLLNYAKQEAKIMSFEKAIKHRKERRKPYYGNKNIDPHCRNHGCCSWCEENRKYQSIKQEERIKDMEKEYDNGRNK